MSQGPSSRQGATTSEAELVRDAQAGDERAFEQLARVHADRLFAVLLSLLGDEILV